MLVQSHCPRRFELHRRAPCRHRQKSHRYAARVIGLLEEWFTEYTEKNTSGLVAPQGSINAIQAGWTHKPAFVPAACHFYVDLRISPRVSPQEAKRQFGEAIERIVKANPDLSVDWEMILSIPGSYTDPRTGSSNPRGRGSLSKTKSICRAPKPAAPPMPISSAPRNSHGAPRHAAR